MIGKASDTGLDRPLDTLFTSLWSRFAAGNPQAGRIHDLLAARGENVYNDHIALRTLAMPGLSLDDLAAPFVAAGYVEKGRYVFADKHLTAKHWQHPDTQKPKVFISQLEAQKLSPGAHSILLGLANQAQAKWIALKQNGQPLCNAGRLWSLSRAEYETLARESEYAGWLAAWGYVANHFTVAAHALRSFLSLHDLNVFLMSQGFALNQAGGAIKGSPSDFLEQSSTLAAMAEADFSDGSLRLPYCYYEFAWRFKQPDGQIFQGFLEKSADKIFESTHRNAAR